jgi:hypothetical protein
MTMVACDFRVGTGGGAFYGIGAGYFVGASTYLNFRN